MSVITGILHASDYNIIEFKSYYTGIFLLGSMIILLATGIFFKWF